MPVSPGAIVLHDFSAFNLQAALSTLLGARRFVPIESGHFRFDFGERFSGDY